MQAEIDKKLVDWLLSGNTGASSKCMAAHLTGRETDGNYPHDSGDFGRCVGLLEAVPELRERLPKMATCNRYWKAIIAQWAEIEDMPREEQREALQRIIGPIEKEDKNVVRLSPVATIRFGGKIQ